LCVCVNEYGFKTFYFLFVIWIFSKNIFFLLFFSTTIFLELLHYFFW
jgi:hypothetical protein